MKKVWLTHRFLFRFNWAFFIHFFNCFAIRRKNLDLKKKTQFNSKIYLYKKYTYSFSSKIVFLVNSQKNEKSKIKYQLRDNSISVIYAANVYRVKKLSSNLVYQELFLYMFRQTRLTLQHKKSRKKLLN